MSHSFYVWCAYGLSFLMMGLETLILIRRRKALRHAKISERKAEL